MLMPRLIPGYHSGRSRVGRLLMMGLLVATVLGPVNALADEALVVKGKPEAAAELTLTGIEPSPLVASDGPQHLILQGTGFTAGSRVALSHGARVEVLPASQVTFISEGQLGIDVSTGRSAASWAVQVSLPDNRRSNVLRFQVMAPVPRAVETEVPESKQETLTTQQPPTMPAATAVSAKAISTSELLGSDWLAAQPKQHYALQLLASRSRVNVTAFIRQHPQLPAPLLSFTTEKEGVRLHVLAQGSYPSREAAMAAAKALPQGLTPWPRSMASMQQVVVNEPTPPAREVSAGGQSRGVIKDIAWVWSQDPNHFTVQLAAAESERAIEAVMRRMNLPGELVVVQSERHGKQWYALIYGSFASMDAARAIIERLPVPLKQAGPWPRRFASLQSELSRSTP